MNEKAIELLEEYKEVCIGFQTDSHHKGSRSNTKYWNEKIKEIIQALALLKAETEEESRPDVSEEDWKIFLEETVRIKNEQIAQLQTKLDSQQKELTALKKFARHIIRIKNGDMF